MFRKLFFLVSFHLIAFTSVEQTSFAERSLGESCEELNRVEFYMDGVKCENEAVDLDIKNGILKCRIKSRALKPMQEEMVERCDEDSKWSLHNVMKYMLKGSMICCKGTLNVVWVCCKGTLNVVCYALEHPYVSLTVFGVVYRYLPDTIQDLIYDSLKESSIKAVKFVIAVIKDAIRGTVSVATDAVSVVWSSVWNYIWKK